MPACSRLHVWYPLLFIPLLLQHLVTPVKVDCALDAHDSFARESCRVYVVVDVGHVVILLTIATSLAVQGRSAAALAGQSMKFVVLTMR